MIKGDIVHMTSMTLDDVFSFRNHGIHEDRRLMDYNFKFLTDSEIKSWYDFKINRKSSFYYTINSGTRKVGFISIKNVSTKFSMCSIGISIGAIYTGCGYGKDALITMINYYIRLGIKKFYLRVHTDNLRALNLYKNLGFKRVFTWYTILPSEILPYVEKKDRISLFGMNFHKYFLMKKVML